MTRSGLSPIESVEDRRWRPPSPSRALLALFTVFAVANWCYAARGMWDMRDPDALPLWSYAVAAGSCLLGPASLIFGAWRRRSGPEMHLMLLIVTIVVTWLCVFIVFMVTLGFTA